ncbi:MAG: prolyl oligopeptidase family serine peptidase [Candidatus Neomarinimicrobiota bacterium]
MKKPMILFLAIVSIFSNLIADDTMKYPETRKENVVDTFYGTKVEDPYRWLEDDNSAETAEWVKKQNEVTFSYLNKLPGRDEIKQRLTELWDYPQTGTPFTIAGRWFVFKNDGLQNQSVLYIMDKVDDEPRVLLDPNKLSDDGTVAYTGMDVSPDGKYLVYKIARSGSDWNEIFVMDIASGKMLEDHIKWVKFSNLACYKDGFFYSAYDQPQEGDELSQANSFQKIYFHRYYSDQSEDELIFSNPNDPKRMYTASLDEENKYLFISETESTTGNSLYIKNLYKKNSPIMLLAKGFDHDFIPIAFERGKALVQTNHKAQKYRVIAIDPKDSAPENWEEIIPETSNTLQGISHCGGKLFVNYMVDVSSKVKIYSMRGKDLGDVELPGICSVGRFSGSKKGKVAFYSYSSYNTPGTIYKYHTKTGKSEEYFTPPLKFDPNDFVVKQEFYESKDGTRIPMTIFHKKGIELDGNNPTLLYGYGGFNVSLTPGFAKSSLFFAEQGGVYAVANIRGGGEYGEAWHKAGTLMQKQNVFDDFISAAEYLIDRKYTNSAKLAIRGGSNGGLLVGAVVNQRPDLFKVALPAVGVMDMLRYHKFTIGYAWATDYGTVDDSEDMFNYLLNYSPIHNVKAQDYPAIMVSTADHDDRVVPAHSFKYISEIQAKNTGDLPTLIRIAVKAGHGSGKPTAMIIDEYTDMFAFILYHLNR